MAASLAMQRAGAPAHAVHCMLDTLQHLRHHIQTSFGDSVSYFDSNDHSGIPLGGIGQGNGAGPAIWALVSTPIFNALRKRGYGVFLPCPLSGRLLHFAGYAFVDDTDLSVTDQQNQTPMVADITTTMQASVTLWEGFIRASGGALRPEKSHWYLVDFEWDQGNWTYVQSTPSDPVLTVRTHLGEQ